MDYKEYIESDAWKRKRCEKLGADATILVKCETCGGFFQKHKIHIDHLTYDRFGDELLSDLQPVCESCHEMKHGRQFAGSDTRMAQVASTERPERVSAKEGREVISTGFQSLDYATGGLTAPSLVALASRPSMGKTALLRTILWSVSRTQKTPSLFVSLEADPKDISGRILCAAAGVPCDVLYRGYYEPTQQEAIKAVSAEFSEVPLYFDCPAEATDEYILQALSDQADKLAIKVVAIDYLELVSYRDRGLARHEMIGDFLRRLRSLAREKGICIIIACAVNRSGASENIPGIASIRCPETLDAICDQIWILHRPDYYKPTAEKEAFRAEVGIAKNSTGKTGIAVLDWIPKLTTFREPVYDTDDGFDKYSR